MEAINDKRQHLSKLMRQIDFVILTLVMASLIKDVMNIILNFNCLKNYTCVLKFVCKDWYNTLKCKKQTKYQRKCFMSLLTLNGHHNLRIWVEKNDHSKKKVVKLKDIARAGHLKLFKERTQEVDALDFYICLNEATVFGHVNIIRWAISIGYKLDDLFGYHAAVNNRVDIFRLILEKDIPFVYYTLAKTAKAGNLDILKCAAEFGIEMTDDLGEAAAEHAQTDTLYWLLKMGCSWSSDLCANAASAGHIDVVKEGLLNGCELNENIFAKAAGFGSIPFLQWLRDKNCPWNVNACVCAATHGKLDALVWLRENGCPWNSRVTYSAAMHRHYDILQWAIRNGCEIDRYCVLP